MHLRLKLKESHSANTSLLAAAGTPPHTLVPLAFLRGLCQAVPLVEAGGAAVCPHAFPLPLTFSSPGGGVAFA